MTLGGDQAQVGPDRAAGQPGPVADLDGQGERGQGGHCAQAAQPPHYRGELRIGGHRRDCRIDAIPAISAGQHRVECVVMGQLQRGVVESLRTQLPFVPLCPGSSTVVDDPLAQKQFR